MLGVLEKVLQREIFETTRRVKRKFESFYYWEFMIVSNNIRKFEINKHEVGECCSTHEGDGKYEYVENFRRKT
jgi:hypothetical protein